MKKKIVKILILALILIVLFIKIFFLKGLSKTQISDDFLFLKLFSNGASFTNRTQNDKNYSIINRGQQV